MPDRGELGEQRAQLRRVGARRIVRRRNIERRVVRQRVRASLVTTSNIMNATVKRPDSGTKHRMRCPGCSSRSRMKSASMMKIDAAPVLPRAVRLLYQRSRGIERPALRHQLLDHAGKFLRRVVAQEVIDLLGCEQPPCTNELDVLVNAELEQMRQQADVLSQQERAVGFGFRQRRRSRDKTCWLPSGGRPICMHTGRSPLNERLWIQLQLQRHARCARGCLLSKHAPAPSDSIQRRKCESKSVS